VIEGERRKPCHIFRFQSIAFDSKLLQNRIHVDRVPESEDVALFAVKNGRCQAVPILPAVELSKRPPPFKLIIDGCQDMNRLVDAADLGTQVHPTRARRVAKKREVQFGRPGSSTQLDEGKYVRDRAKTFDFYIATI